MKCICPISAVHYEVLGISYSSRMDKISLPQFPTATIFSAPHPIFNVPQTFLLSRTKDWVELRLGDIESRLLFLALLKSTGLVHFQCAAEPSVKTVSQNMSELLRMISWHVEMKGKFHLPQYIVAQDTKYLTEISHFIQSWNDAKNEYVNRRQKSLLSIRADSLEDRIMAKLKSSAIDPDRYAKLMLQWAMDASNLPDKTEADKIIRQQWIDTFCIKENDMAIYRANLVHLEDMYEYFQENLNVAYNYSIVTAVMERLRDRIRRVKGGVLGYLMGDRSYKDSFIILDEDEYDNITGGENIGNSIGRKSNNEGINILNTISDAPIQEPKKSDYPNLVEYIRAKAKWNLSKSYNSSSNSSSKRI